MWEDFFVSIADTVDPLTGQSELIDEMLKSSGDQSDDAQESQLVAESLRKGGLLEFLNSDPKLTGTLDFKPYLFLAQTSLSRGQSSSIESIDAKAKSLARSIESEDPLRAKTAAKQAAAQDSSIAAAVVRILLADISNAGTKVQTHGLNGLSAICHAHPEQYIPVLKFLATFNAKNREAVAVSATTIISAAKRNGNEIPDGLETRFTSQSKIAAALAPSSKRTGKKQ